MLSILIPTYNYNAYPLACQLEKQALNANIDFEIICFDDGSKSSANIENERINKLWNSRFTTLSENIGLSNNRNALVKASAYNYLLFIDGDSILPDNKFITRYLRALENEPDVIYGGRIHPDGVEPNRKLRWKYGKYVEDLNVQQRNKNIYKSVLFNNTLIKKSVFKKNSFEKSIIQYGHEDTIFAYHLSKVNASTIHINNPVLHGDVDINQVYIEKTKKSLENLNLIYRTGLVELNFITFLKVFGTLKNLRINYIFALIDKIFRKAFTKHLSSKNPSLYIFNLFRLSYFCHINLKK